MRELLLKYTTEIISGLGAVGSLVGALISWLQFRNAKNSAQQAKNSEQRLLNIIKKNEMSRDTQRIRGLVERLSKYVRRGQKIGGSFGLNLSDDIEKVIVFRNDFASNSQYYKDHTKELTEINRVATSINFSGATEDDRISSINAIIEGLNAIAVSIDEKVSKHD